MEISWNVIDRISHEIKANLNFFPLNFSPPDSDNFFYLNETLQHKLCAELTRGKKGKERKRIRRAEKNASCKNHATHPQP